jgi:hypothetical protein
VVVDRSGLSVGWMWGKKSKVAWVFALSR